MYGFLGERAIISNFDQNSTGNLQEAAYKWGWQSDMQRIKYSEHKYFIFKQVLAVFYTSVLVCYVFVIKLTMRKIGLNWKVVSEEIFKCPPFTPPKISCPHWSSGAMACLKIALNNPAEFSSRVFFLCHNCMFLQHPSDFTNKFIHSLLSHHPWLPRGLFITVN